MAIITISRQVGSLGDEIAEAVSLPVIASGGAGNLDHLVEAVLAGKAKAVLAASIFHFGEYTVQDVKDYLKKNNLEVRR